ncbi:MAG: FAD binding domain-containing protein, partial [Tepidisphaeraceae bacterium]
SPRGRGEGAGASSDAPAPGRIDYRPVTSCIQFLFQLDGAHVVTVEGLKYDETLNPVQEAMVRCHGAQCGFCTPGFVVSMCAAFDRGQTEEEPLRAALVGNLCRCTGYESIVHAGLEVKRDAMRRIDDLYPPAALIDAMSSAHREPVLIHGSDKTFFKPTTVSAAADFKAKHPDCVLVAGGTDVGVQVNKCVRDPRVLMSLAGLTELREIHERDGMMTVGALATLADLEQATLDRCPELNAMLRRHGSPLIRNAGTLAGNIANGSPIGDAMPALFVLGAEIELAGRGGATRRVDINNFYTGYKTNVMRPDELIAHVHIPLPSPTEVFKLYKVSKRHDLDISSFMAAFYARLRSDVIEQIRIAYGGVGPVILRLPKTEAFLTGQPLNEETMAAGGELARTEIAPISDVRGSADFRLQLGENIIRRFHAEVAASHDLITSHDGDGNGRPR